MPSKPQQSIDPPEQYLALGTAQFGLAYGIAGNDRAATNQEVSDILAAAWEVGINVLDTAPDYGSIEARLADCIGTKRFRIVSKIPALPVTERNGACDFITRSIERSHQRLGEQLETLLFHRAEDLLGPCGAEIWDCAYQLAATYDIRLGVSCYSPEVGLDLCRRYGASVCQLPGNALDQRLNSTSLQYPGQSIEVHLRSIFLQGLLLQPIETVEQLLPAASESVKAWILWCNELNMTPLTAALSAARSLTGVDFCLAGVDCVAHVDALATAWDDSKPMDIANLACTDPGVIDPREWPQ